MHATYLDTMEAVRTMGPSAYGGHSPILLGSSGAQLLSFDGGTIHATRYHDTDAYNLTRRFLLDPRSILDELFAPD